MRNRSTLPCGDAGVTLIDLIVGIAISIIAVAGAMKIYSSFNETVTLIAGRHDWETSTALVERTIRDEANCSNAFQKSNGTLAIYSQNVPLGDIAASSPLLDRIALRGMTPVIKMGQKFGIGAGGKRLAVSALRLVNVGGWVEADRLALPSPPSSMSWRWKSQLTVIASEPGGTNPISKIYYLNILTALAPPATAPIISCSGGSALTEKDICDAVKGWIYNASSKICRRGIELRTSDPLAPFIGQMWVRTDL